MTAHAWCFPLPPVSVNHLYATVDGHRVMVRPARNWQQLVIAACRQPYTPLPGGPLAIEIAVRFPDDLRRRDVANIEKLTCDSIAKAHEIDDSAFWDVHLYRILAMPNGSPCLYVRVRKLSAVRDSMWWLKVQPAPIIDQFLPEAKRA